VNIEYYIKKESRPTKWPELIVLFLLYKGKSSFLKKQM